MDRFIFEGGGVVEILVTVILLMLGIIWRDLNNKIQVLFKKQEGYVSRDMMEIGVNADVHKLYAIVEKLDQALRNHMDSERVMYLILVGVMFLGFSILTILMLVIYFSL